MVFLQPFVIVPVMNSLHKLSFDEWILPHPPPFSSALTEVEICLYVNRGGSYVKVM